MVAATAVRFTAADFADFAPRDAELPCPKCTDAPGVYVFSNGKIGPCFRCGTTRTVRTRRDQTAYNAWTKRRDDIRTVVLTSVPKLSPKYYALSRAWDELYAAEPHRIPALCASVANGRLDAVVTAMLAYAGRPA